MKFGLVVGVLVLCVSVQALEIQSSVSGAINRKKHHQQKSKVVKHAKPHTKFGQTTLKKKAKNPIVVPIRSHHKAVHKANLVRFRSKIQIKDDAAASSDGDDKLHISDKQPKGLQLTGSEAQVGTTSELKVNAESQTEATADYQMQDQLSTYSGGAYSAGLGDQAQASATIEDEMANQLKTISTSISDETNRATKAEDQIKTDYTNEVEKNKQERQSAEKDLDSAISKEQNARKEADDTRAKSENDVTQNLNDQISKLNDKVSQCSQNVQKAVQKANSLESIVNAYTDKKGGGTKIAFLSENEHITHLHRLHLQFEKMQSKHGF